MITMANNEYEYSYYYMEHAIYNSVIKLTIRKIKLTLPNKAKEKINPLTGVYLLTILSGFLFV